MAAIETYFIPVSELHELVERTSGSVYIVGEQDAKVLINGEVTRSPWAHGCTVVETEVGIIHYDDDEEIDLIEVQ